MDTSPTGDRRSTPELEAWSSHVVTSRSPTLLPTQASDFAFDLNSVNVASQSLPNYQLSKCSCGPGCMRACCKSAALLAKQSSSVVQPLLSPVENQGRSDSPTSFGSTGSDEPLIANHGILPVRH